MIRVLPPAFLCACVVHTTLPPEAPCEQVYARYANRVYTCSQDPDRATLDTDALRGAYACAIEGWAPIDTGYFLSSDEHALDLAGSDATVSIESAWRCSEILIEIPCDRLLAFEPGEAWLEQLSSGCAAIFDGPGEEPTGTGFPYTTPTTTTTPYGY